MELIKEYSEKYGMKEVVNNYGEHRQTREKSIVFPNGWVVAQVLDEDAGFDKTVYAKELKLFELVPVLADDGND